MKKSEGKDDDEYEYYEEYYDEEAESQLSLAH